MLNRDKRINEEKTNTQPHKKLDSIWKMLKKEVGIEGIVGIVGAIISAGMQIYNIVFNDNNITWQRIIFIPMLISTVLVGSGVGKKANEIELEKKQEKYWEKVQKLEGDKNLSDRDALELIKVNLANINEYYIWSQKQAKSAFNTAIATCSVGFLLVVAAVLVPIVKQDFNSTISFISFLGGAITEVIGGTIFFVYRKSLTQLNYYHKALHEDQRFLSSVNLINKFHDENMGDEMLKEIIQSAIDINRAEFGHSEEKKADKNKSDT